MLQKYDQPTGLAEMEGDGDGAGEAEGPRLEDGEVEVLLSGEGLSSVPGNLMRTSSVGAKIPSELENNTLIASSSRSLG